MLSGQRNGAQEKANKTWEKERGKEKEWGGRKGMELGTWKEAKEEESST